MLIQPVDLTSALRPVLLPDEVLLFVQDAIGLYQGQYKLPNQQNGQAYLTTHRIYYVDTGEPRKNSIAVELKGVERIDLYAGFLKASPKITLVPKQNEAFVTGRVDGLGRVTSRSGTPSIPGSPLVASTINGASSATNSPNVTPATWVCPVCGLPNTLPSTFDATTASVHTPLPSCSACGVKPPLALLLKVAIASVSGRSEVSSNATLKEYKAASPSNHHGRYFSDGHTSQIASPSVSTRTQIHTSYTSNQCPKCTFNNHASMFTCEMCGSRLPSANRPQEGVSDSSISRLDSPDPMLKGTKTLDINSSESIKLSFRAGGFQTFHEKLKVALNQRKWLLRNAPPVPKSQSYHTTGTNTNDHVNTPPRKQVGIASLETTRETQRKTNELTLATSFADLSALMASAKEILALAESFATSPASSTTTTDTTTKSANALLQESAAALGMVTTKNLLSPHSSSSNSHDSDLYVSELSRSLAELLTDESSHPQGSILTREGGGIISTIDLWAIVNRLRGGLECITPQDFDAATKMWEKLKLPVRLRVFRNGVSVVQRREWTDEKTVGMLLGWLAALHHQHDHQQQHGTGGFLQSRDDIQMSAYTSYWGRGVSIHETAQQFGWSLGVASEELQMAEEEGALVREETVEGLVYWENWIVWGTNGDGEGDDDEEKWRRGDGGQEKSDEEVVVERMREVGIM